MSSGWFGPSRWPTVGLERKPHLGCTSGWLSLAGLQKERFSVTGKPGSAEPSGSKA